MKNNRIRSRKVPAEEASFNVFKERPGNRVLEFPRGLDVLPLITPSISWSTKAGGMSGQSSHNTRGGLVFQEGSVGPADWRAHSWNQKAKTGEPDRQ